MAKSLQVPRVQGGLNPVCWTFIFRGGVPFTLSFGEGYVGPGHDHNGKMSLWKFMGTSVDADVVETAFRDAFPELRIERHTEVENDEMRAIRRERLGHGPAGD